MCVAACPCQGDLLSITGSPDCLARKDPCASLGTKRAHRTRHSGLLAGAYDSILQFLRAKKASFVACFYYCFRLFFCFVSFKQLLRDQIFFCLKISIFIIKEQQTILDSIFPVTFVHQITTAARNFPVIGTFPTDEFFRTLWQGWFLWLLPF